MMHDFARCIVQFTENPGHSRRLRAIIKGDRRAQFTNDTHMVERLSLRIIVESEISGSRRLVHAEESVTIVAPDCLDLRLFVDRCSAGSPYMTETIVSSAGCLAELPSTMLREQSVELLQAAVVRFLRLRISQTRAQACVERNIPLLRSEQPKVFKHVESRRH